MGENLAEESERCHSRTLVASAKREGDRMIGALARRQSSRIGLSAGRRRGHLHRLLQDSDDFEVELVADPTAAWG